MITFLKKYWISTSVILTIFVLCMIDTAPLPEAPMRDFDKLVHIVMFMGISGVIFFDNTGYLRFPVSRMRIFLNSFLFPVALGGFIEIVQEYFTKTRNGDWYDFLFDIVGAFLGLVIVLLINHWLMLRKK